MLKALGYRFLDKDGYDPGEGAQALSKIASISTENMNPLLKDCEFQVACDVTNPLCGPNGATYIYGPQKGVTEEMKAPLDTAMEHYAKVTADATQTQFADATGAGAAGGLGFAFLSYLKATLVPGIDLILDAINLEKELQDADVVVTGEWEKPPSALPVLRKNTEQSLLPLPEVLPRMPLPATRQESMPSFQLSGESPLWRKQWTPPTQEKTYH